MHVIFVPYSLMKTDPASWLKLLTRNNGQYSPHRLWHNVYMEIQNIRQIISRLLTSVLAGVGIAKSRDMHWGMLAKKDHKDIDLKSLRLLLVADGANPCKLSPLGISIWILSFYIHTVVPINSALRCYWICCELLLLFDRVPHDLWLVCDSFPIQRTAGWSCMSVCE